MDHGVDEEEDGDECGQEEPFQVEVEPFEVDGDVLSVVSSDGLCVDEEGGVDVLFDLGGSAVAAFGVEADVLLDEEVAFEEEEHFLFGEGFFFEGVEEVLPGEGHALIHDY